VPEAAKAKIYLPEFNSRETERKNKDRGALTAMYLQYPPERAKRKNRNPQLTAISQEKVDWFL